MAYVNRSGNTAFFSGATSVAGQRLQGDEAERKAAIARMAAAGSVASPAEDQERPSVTPPAQAGEMQEQQEAVARIAAAGSVTTH